MRRVEERHERSEEPLIVQEPIDPHSSAGITSASGDNSDSHNVG